MRTGAYEPLKSANFADLTSAHEQLLHDLAALASTGELLVEDFAIINGHYKRLIVAGWSFATEFTLLMKLLSTQAMHTDDDPDSDEGVDDGHENDRDNNSFGDGSSFDWLCPDGVEMPGAFCPCISDSGSSEGYWSQHIERGSP